MATSTRPPKARAVVTAPVPKETLDEAVRRRARELGFDVVGVARADEPLSIDHARYLEFTRRGLHGAMDYLADNPEARRRLDTDDILAGAKSVICVGTRYRRPDDDADPPLARTIARYARGQDYHVFLRKRLRRLAAYVRTLAPGVRARPLCDVEPVLERAWAVRAGLGFVGKNGLVITPGQGSYQLLGEVVTTLELVADTPMAERCGSCVRCLEACPTSAFVAPFVLDPRRCIAYLTIEHREAPPEELREAIGDHLFGCDDCQDVCPYNRAPTPDDEKARPFRPHARWGELGLHDLAGLDEEAWAALSLGSPLQRAGRGGLARNAAIVANNRFVKDPNDAEAREAIARARAHDDPMVRASAIAPSTDAANAPPRGPDEELG